MKVAIIGIEGQLGRDVAAALSEHDIVSLAHPVLDICDAEATTAVIADNSPAWVINCAAMTNVDKCETEPEPAFQVNAIAARNVAEACRTADARLVHISTDYVFDGDKATAYVETDAVRPINAYGMSKLVGEWMVADACPQHYIVRTSGLYGLHQCRGKGTNFVETMLRLGGERSELKVVDDERLTPTYTPDLAVQLERLLAAPPQPGIYHATNSGECSWFEFATEIFRLSGIDVRVEGIASSEWPTKTRRPRNSVLDNRALREAGIDVMPQWHTSLAEYLGARLGGGN